MHVAVVSNAAAGHGAAPALYAAHVAPWLRDVVRGDASHIATYTTEPEHGARRIGAQLAHEPPSMLVVLGGDGTLHELLEGLLGARARLAHPVQVVLVPTGTANALYASLYRPTLPAADAADADAWRLRALGARDAAAPAQALTVLRVHAPAAHLACVVTSHALHAAILRDSEALRAEHPGVERFKMAAMQNVATWYRARLTLHAGACGVRVYRPQADAFEDVGDDYERTDAGDAVVAGTGESHGAHLCGDVHGGLLLWSGVEGPSSRAGAGLATGRPPGHGLEWVLDAAAHAVAVRPGMVVRAAEGAGLENRCAVTPCRGFESLTIRVHTTRGGGPDGPPPLVHLEATWM